MNGCEYQECESGAIPFFSIPGESAAAVQHRESTVDDDRAAFGVKVGIGAPRTSAVHSTHVSKARCRMPSATTEHWTTEGMRHVVSEAASL